MFSDAFMVSVGVLTTYVSQIAIEREEVYGGREFFASEFWAKTSENPNFFIGQLLLRCTYLEQNPMYGIPMLATR